MKPDEIFLVAAILVGGYFLLKQTPAAAASSSSASTSASGPGGLVAAGETALNGLIGGNSGQTNSGITAGAGILTGDLTDSGIYG